MGRSIGLGVNINDQHRKAFTTKISRQIDDCSGFANAVFLVIDGDNRVEGVIVLLIWYFQSLLGKDFTIRTPN